MKKGIIITNAYVSGEGQRHQVKRLAEEFAAKGVEISVRPNYDTAYLDGRRAALSIGQNDFVIYLDKDTHIAALLEKAGARVFNSAYSIAVTDDKMATYIALSDSGIAMPVTVNSPLNYAREWDNKDFLDGVEAKLGYPLIVKQCHGSMGQQVFLAQNRAETEELYAKLRSLPHVYQQFIAKSKGRDTRVIVIGGKVVAAMHRRNDNDYRSNIETGGVGSPCVLSEKYALTAIKAAAICKADYCGIDLLDDGEGNPILCEVNCNAFYKGIESVTGVNVAGAYAEYIYSVIYGKE